MKLIWVVMGVLLVAQADDGAVQGPWTNEMPL